MRLKEDDFLWNMSKEHNIINQFVYFFLNPAIWCVLKRFCENNDPLLLCLHHKQDRLTGIYQRRLMYRQRPEKFLLVYTLWFSEFPHTLTILLYQWLWKAMTNHVNVSSSHRGSWKVRRIRSNTPCLSSSYCSIFLSQCMSEYSTKWVHLKYSNTAASASTVSFCVKVKGQPQSTNSQGTIHPETHLNGFKTKNNTYFFYEIG